MKRVLKPKSNLKYLILTIINLIIMYYMPLILKTGQTINVCRYNLAIIFIWLSINTVVVYKIENN